MTLRPDRGNAPTDHITGDDLGEHFTGMHFEAARPAPRGLLNRSWLMASHDGSPGDALIHRASASLNCSWLIGLVT